MNVESDVYPGQGASESLLPRRDPVFYGPPAPYNDARGERALSASQLAEYGRKGFLLIGDAFSRSELAALERAAARLHKKALAAGLSTSTGPKASASRGVSHKDARFLATLATDARIVGKVRQILASEVYLHHCEVNIAHRGSGDSWRWHAPFERCHTECGFPRMRCVEAWLLLSDSTPYNGPMRLLAKSHRIYVSCAKGGNGHGGPSLETLDRMLDATTLVNVYAPAGTIVLADSNLMCGSTTSAVPFTRALVTYSYNSVKNRPPAMAQRPRGAGLKIFFPFKIPSRPQ
jgi:ectoine hydroxylase